MKRNLIIALLFSVLMILTVFSAVSSAAVSDDPSESYQVQTAANEDSSLNLWFDYSFRKTFTGDNASTGMNTFSIYMAKNEIEDAQFVLYSDVTHTGMSAGITDFTDSDGNTVDASLYYEMYVTIDNLDKTSVYKSTVDTTIIREGECPDPIVPLDNLGTFKLNAGKSQAFLIRAKTTPETQNGWYSAQLNIYDSAKNTVKTATVYLYVWNFELSEKTALESAFYINDDKSFGGSYKDFYDYLLENRMCGMDLPTGVVSSNSPYVTNDRVVSVRISSEAHPSYLNRLNMGEYRNIYNDLAATPTWNEIRNKLYVYTADEPLPKSIVADYRDTVDSAKKYTDIAEEYWGESPRTLITLTENHAYPYDYYMKPLSEIPQGELEDSVEAFFEYDKIDIFCPIIGEFTPYEEVMSLPGRNGITTPGIRLSCSYPYSGAYGGVGAGHYGFFDWDKFYGASTVDRYRSYINYKNSLGDSLPDRELWLYNAGQSHSYTYCNHMIENTGLQTKLLFWQCFKEDVTGYLYYATNNWTSAGLNYGNYDSTVTGSKSTCQWYINPYTGSNNSTAYGDGVLFYGANMGRVRGIPLIGSLRVEIMRDSIEEYQMMYQLEELKGEKCAKAFVNSVSDSMINYISMPAYNRSAWDSDMDSYDIVESVRRSLGSSLEEAVNEAVCNHKWDSVTVTKSPTCQHTGIKTYKCTLCDAENTEYIPSIHTQNTTFVKVSGNAPTCTEDGQEIFRCNLCDFEKTVRTPSNHTNPHMTTPVYKNTDNHSLICNVCGNISATEGHAMYNNRTEPTCTKEGQLVAECKVCKYSIVEETFPKKEHTYVNGICTECGEREFGIPGDLNGDSKINASDRAILKKVIVGKQMKTPNADVDSDGKITGSDAILLKKKIVGKA